MAARSATGARKSCPVCGTKVLTYKSTGTLWRHTHPGTGATCAGSNSKPSKTTTTDAQEATTMPSPTTTEPAAGQPGALPRGTCPRCGRDVALRKGGELREHTIGTMGNAGKCEASGMTIDEARAAMPDPHHDSDTALEEAAEARDAGALDTTPDTEPTTPAEAVKAAAEHAAPPAHIDLQELDAGGDARGRLFHLPPSSIAPSPDNPRQDLGDLTELAASIREAGVIEPIVATRGPDGTVTVAAGSRRHAAALEAGAATVPVLVRDDVDAAARAELALIENLHRKDLTPLEEAGAFRRLLDDFGYTQGRLAKRLARSQGHISKRLALLKLPDDVRARVGTSIHVADAVDLARLPKAEAAKVIEQATRKAPTKRPEDVADAVAAATRAAVAEHDRKARQRAKRDELKAAGVTVLKTPDYNRSLHGTGWARLATDKPDRIGAGTVVALSDDEHRGFPCHGVIVWDDAGTTAVCTDPDNHLTDDQKADRDAAAQAAAAAPTADERAAQRQADADAAEARTSALDAAAGVRRGLLARLVKDRLPQAAVVDLVAAHMLSLYDPEAYAGEFIIDQAGALLEGRDEPDAEDERPYPVVIADLAYNFGTLTVALAVTLLDSEGDLAATLRRPGDTLDASSGHVARYLRFLVDVGGYTLTDDERQLLEDHDAEVAAVAESFAAGTRTAAVVTDTNVADQIEGRTEPAASIDDWEDPTPPPPADKVKAPKR